MSDEFEYPTSVAASSESSYIDSDWTPHSLPDGRNVDGRPVWEPPIFDYSQWIEDEYEKKREAMLEFMEGNRAATTDMMDIDTELELSIQYWCWAADNGRAAEDDRCRSFFEGLAHELGEEYDQIYREWRDEGAAFFDRGPDGTYVVFVDVLIEDEESFGGNDSSDENHTTKQPDPASQTSSIYLSNTFQEGQPSIQQQRISSEGDGKEDLAWLASINAARTFSPLSNSRTAVVQQIKPLVLQFISRHHDTSSAVGQKETRTNHEDEVD